KEESLDNFGVATDSGEQHDTFLSRHLRWLGAVTFRQAKLLLAITGVVLCIAAYGISKIQINDNPIKWFSKSHPIRQADRVLNHHFGGTYEAYLVLESPAGEMDVDTAARLAGEQIKTILIDDRDSGIIAEAVSLIRETGQQAKTTKTFFTSLSEKFQDRQYAADDHGYDLWARLLDTLDQVQNRGQIFKDPAVLRYITKLQDHIQQSGVVGKSNSITDVVKKVHQELFSGNPDHFTVPETANGVAQCLISYQNSHKPDDLFHFITPDYKQANIWVQLKSGDNKDMEAVVKKTERFFADNPPPVALNHQWAGLTYLNVVWQDKMVSGMLESFLGSFVIVFVMMAFLFRSIFWGLLAMVPLSVTIAFIYGLIGIIGKDYDMPVAVLSSLTLGMAVDFAIHFLERTRATVKKCGSWAEGIKEMFEEPARAITRNVIVIAIGFTPLLAAPLIPYKTVGIFLASIMAISGIGTMFILPALVTVFERWLFRADSE
ncbi:MAG: MMPL family transporter, partial [Desulfobulbaceae bacterium]|nr:MMPL family transporter [Desulfobulbaceae bacterium]